MILVGCISALLGEGNQKASRLWAIACKLDVGFFIWLSNELLHCHFGSYMQKKPPLCYAALILFGFTGFLFCLASHSDDKSIYIFPGWSCFSYFLCETLVPDHLFSPSLSLLPSATLSFSPGGAVPTPSHSVSHAADLICCGCSSQVAIVVNDCFS